MSHEPRFLDVTAVITVHMDQMMRYGGHAGVRDFALLDSAVAMPTGRFGGEWLHRDLYEMAAAYAFHIAKNHPFVDGNKRTAIAAALAFLDINGIVLLDLRERLYNAIADVVSGELDKLAFAEVLKSLPHA